MHQSNFVAEHQVKLRKFTTLKISKAMSLFCFVTEVHDSKKRPDVS